MVKRRSVCGLLALLPGAPLWAQPATFRFDGEDYAQQFVGAPPHGDRVMEFVRPTENLNNWTRLVGLRYQPMPFLGNDPVAAALRLEQVVMKANPQARTHVMSNEAKTDATIDFLTWTDGQDIMEFNVFRYVKSPDGRGLVSLQVAHRFHSGQPQVGEKLRATRASWVRQVVQHDMGAVTQAVLALR
jgi:hypothetical protein